MTIDEGIAFRQTPCYLDFCHHVADGVAANLMYFRFHNGSRVAINVPNASALLEAIEGRLRSGCGFAVATLNLDHLVKLRLRGDFREAYMRQTFVVADGNPVVWLSRLARRPVELVPGSELVEPLAALAVKLDVPVALFGSSEETLVRASQRLQERHPGLRVCARIAPPYGLDPAGSEADAGIDAVARSGARLCLLALGAPKQEILAARALKRAPGCGFVSVGAGLDFVAEAQHRAPLWVRRFALEWLWRLLGDPRRLARRYADCALLLPSLAFGALRLRWHQEATDDVFGA